MIDASNITAYNLNDSELEERILFWVCAAGKNGTTAARLLDAFLVDIGAGWGGHNYSPFMAIKAHSSPLTLPYILKTAGIGCYTHKAITMWELANANLDLKTCTAEDLEEIYGIGMKTSRCFIIHSRKNAQYAGIDTHMLKNLRVHGVDGVPKTTPTSKKLYMRLENEVLRLAKEAGMTPAEYDLAVWNSYAVK